LIGSHLGWGTISVAGDEPRFVVASGELDECGSQLFDGVEGPRPQQVLDPNLKTEVAKSIEAGVRATIIS
jgi:hypothetical protein